MDNGRGCRVRWGYLAVNIIAFIIELVIALYVRDHAIRPYIRDTLVVVPVYCFARIPISIGMRRVSLYVLLFAACMGVTQYFRLAEILGPWENVAAKTILGSVFNWEDITCYGTGCLLTQISKIRRRAL